ncbi:MAG: hypothetical protein QOI48_3566 [Solirubrobacteraceae bacterium]|nr:hypothetical protein [Solirubrobacteraceae bacterium]
MLARRTTALMPRLDERVDLGRIRDLRGRGSHPWIRRVFLTILGVGVVVASTGAIGQPTQALVTGGAGARLRVEVPDVLRGGLLAHARIVVRAARTISHPRIVLGPGFFEGLQVNTIEPSPQSEASRGRHVVLSYAELKPGDELVVYLQLQVNPTTVGDQDTTVQLDDETEPVARIAHTTTVLP